MIFEKEINFKKLSCIFLALISVLLVFFLGNGFFASQSTTSNNGSGVQLIIDDSASPITAPVVDGALGIRIPGYAVLRIPAEQTEVEIPLINPEGNPCYFVYEIVLSETNEVLYKSNMIEPGSEIRQETLGRALAAGEYPVQVKVNTYELENLTAMNGALIKATLIVQ